MRVHDSSGYLKQVETVRGQAIAPSVSGAGGGSVPLPLVYDDGRVRDYGAFVPLNLQMQLNVASPQLKLSDNSGQAVAAQALSFQAADLPSAPAQAGTSKFRSAFFAPNATVIHVYVIGVH